MPFNPVVGVIVLVAAGVAGVATFTASKFAFEVAPRLELKDLLPMPPPNPPLPKFMYEKPEVLKSMWWWTE